MQTKTLSLTRILLLCGAIAGPLFLLTVLIQDYTVPAFNPRLQALSLLSLGDWGWVQIVYFVLAAALAVFARFFLARKERWWAFYCLASAVLILLVFFGGISNPVLMARTLRLGTLVGWMAASVIAIKLLCAPDTAQHKRD